MRISELIYCIAICFLFIASKILIVKTKHRLRVFFQMLYTLSAGLIIFRFCGTLLLIDDPDLSKQAKIESFFLGIFTLYFIYIRYVNAQMRHDVCFIIDEIDYLFRDYSLSSRISDYKYAIISDLDDRFAQGFYGLWNSKGFSYDSETEKYISERFDSYVNGGTYLDYIYLAIQGITLSYECRFDFRILEYCEIRLLKRHYRNSDLQKCIQKIHYTELFSHDNSAEYYVVRYLTLMNMAFNNRNTPYIDRVSACRDYLLDDTTDTPHCCKEDILSYTNQLIGALQKEITH